LANVPEDLQQKSGNGWFSTLELIQNFRLSLISLFVKCNLDEGAHLTDFILFQCLDRKSAKRTPITVRNRRQNIELDQNHTNN
jgi:hypothetical protein